jgi:hypothetical protein
VSGKRKKPTGEEEEEEKRNSASLTQMFVFARVFAHSRVFGELPALLFRYYRWREGKVIRWDDWLLLPGIIGRVASSSYPVPCSHFTSTMTFLFRIFFLDFSFLFRLYFLL